MPDHPRESARTLAGSPGGDHTPHPIPQPILVGERDAARMLGVSERHLSSLRREGDVPYRRLGHRVLYSPDELREWVESGCPTGPRQI